MGKLRRLRVLLFLSVIRAADCDALGDSETCTAGGHCNAGGIFAGDMLHMPFPKHSDDGLGSHVMRASLGLGIAELFGMKVVCHPNILFNGHALRTDPQRGSAILLGCSFSANESGFEQAPARRARRKERGGSNASANDEEKPEEEQEDSGAVTQPPSTSTTTPLALVEIITVADPEIITVADPLAMAVPAAVLSTHEIINVTFTSVSDKAKTAGSGSPRVFAFDTLARTNLCTDEFRGNQVNLFFRGPAMSLLRRSYHRHNAPEKIAAPLWGEDAHIRIAMHLRCAFWSAKTEGPQIMSAVDQRLHQLVDALLGSPREEISGEDGVEHRPHYTMAKAAGIKIALVVAFKENPKAQAAVRQIIKNFQEHFGEAVIVFESKAAGMGRDDPDSLERDLAILSTAQFLFIGQSKFGALAAGLQREDGFHVIQDQRDYSMYPLRSKADRELGPHELRKDEPHCTILPNTIRHGLRDLYPRLQAANDTAVAGEGALAAAEAFVKSVTQPLPVCSQGDTVREPSAVLKWVDECGLRVERTKAEKEEFRLKRRKDLNIDNFGRPKGPKKEGKGRQVGRPGEETEKEEL